MTTFDRLFYFGPMLAVFSDENRVQQMLVFESALALAGASQGLFPTEAAEAIEVACRAEKLDLGSLRDDAARTGNLAIPLIMQLTAAVQGISPDAARFVHWGATSQDVIDTGLVLQMREALRLIDGQLLRLSEGLAVLAERHTVTILAGRTWMQQAVPITFGWKVATWLDTMLRSRDRLREIGDRSLVLQFGGAAGTLASLGADGPAVSRRLSKILCLAETDISWHTSRDRFAEVVAQLGILVASLGNIARDLSVLMQTEVAEAMEGAAEGRGGSPTMPHNRNPVACAAILAASSRVPGLVASVLTSVVQEHERGLGNWQSDWETIPEVFNLCSGALEKAHELIVGLEVDGECMEANRELTQGLVYAEAASMALSTHIGNPAAHALVERLCRVAIASKSHLRDVLASDEDVVGLLLPAELERLFDPSQYLGNASRSIERVLMRASTSGVATESGWIEHAGTRIYFQTAGRKDLPVLVLSNSLSSDLTMWDAQLAVFAGGFRIVRYDTRGHGRSSATPGPYSIDLLGRDLIALLDALGIQRFSFCGLSMGGMLGQWLALHAAQRIDKLVLCNTAAKIGSHDAWNVRIAVVENDGVRAVIPAVLERWFTPAFLSSHPGVVARTHAMMQTTSSDGYVGCCIAVRDADFRDVIQRIDVPTLVVAGTHDPATPIVDGRYLAEKISGARFVELNASHLSNVEVDREFNAAVLQFLNG